MPVQLLWGDVLGVLPTMFPGGMGGGGGGGVRVYDKILKWDMREFSFAPLVRITPWITRPWKIALH